MGAPLVKSVWLPHIRPQSVVMIADVKGKRPHRGKERFSDVQL